MLIRREFIQGGLVSTLVGMVTAKTAAADASQPRKSTRTPIAVIAELNFRPEDEDAASAALAKLATATQTEPGCRRYVVGRDVSAAGRFHLSEIWDDLSALSAHFRTPHMAEFSATARSLGYSANFMKQIHINSIEDLNPRALARGIK